MLQFGETQLFFIEKNNYNCQHHFFFRLPSLSRQHKNYGILKDIVNGGRNIKPSYQGKRMDKKNDRLI